MRATDDPGVAATIASGLAGAVRSRGVPVEIAAVLELSRALLALGSLQHPHIYWAGRATLVGSPDDFAAYEAAFSEYFELGLSSSVPRMVSVPDESPSPGADAAGGEPDDDRAGYRFSHAERLGQHARQPHDLGPDEVAHLIGLLSRTPEHEVARRLERAPSVASSLDVRRTVAGLLRTDGELIERRYRRRRHRVRRLVLLCDISGSMEPYAPEVLHFAHLLCRSRPRVEVFAMGTRLTRLTRALHQYDPGLALADASGEILDWSGGTRIGDALREFNEQFGLRAAARSADVVICSDGIDRGEPERIAAEMGRLARVAHRIIWVNPLKSTAGYEPLARGMAAAMPFIDEFLPGDSLSALEPLARSLSR